MGVGFGSWSGASWAEWAECRIRPVTRLTGVGTETEPIISVPDNQESNRNRNSQFRFGSAPVLGFFGSVLGSRLFLPRLYTTTRPSWP